MADESPNRSLQFEICDWPTDCDGCGKRIQKGDRHLTGIDSCCGGGCYRCLCLDCVEWIGANASKEAAA